jgi:hypothetical protein
MGFADQLMISVPGRTPPIQSTPPVIRHTVVVDPSTGRAVEAEAVFPNVQLGTMKVGLTLGNAPPCRLKTSISMDSLISTLPSLSSIQRASR